MKRIVIKRFGGPEVLGLAEMNAPRPDAGEVWVSVLAGDVWFTDALVRAGIYLGGPKPPFTPGYELVGVVGRAWPQLLKAAKAERSCVPEAQAVEIPEELILRVRFPLQVPDSTLAPC